MEFNNHNTAVIFLSRQTLLYFKALKLAYNHSLLSLVLICRRPTWDVAAGTAWYNAAAYVNICRRPLSQALIAGLPAKLNSTQLRRQVGGGCLEQIMCRR